MKLFIWEDVENVSRNWHDNGGLCAIAVDLESARKLISDQCKGGDDEDVCEALTVEPDYTADTTAIEQRLFVFPNAGCC